MADPNSGHLIIQVDEVAPDVEVGAVPPGEEEVKVQDTGVAAGTAVTTAGAGAVTMGGAGAVNAAGAGAVTTSSAVAVTTAGAGAVTTIGGWAAVNSAGAGAVTTGGSAAVNTAGAGAVTNSGGTATGGVNTTCAGSVSITGFGAKGNHVEDGAQAKLPWIAGVLGGLADGTAIAAALYKSPRRVAAHGGELVYRLGLATVFAAGVAEMLAAFWVSRDTLTRGSTGKKILYVSLVTLLLGIALDAAAIALKQ